MSTAAEELGTPLDLLLTADAVRPLQRLLPGRSWARLGTGLARRPRAVARRGGSLAGELAAIAVGSSHRAPSGRDRRFADPAWTQNAALRRVVQSYLAAAETAQALADDVDLDWRDRERVDFAVQNLVDALAPSNNALLSPVAWKAVIDTGGASILAGVRSLLRDVAAAPRVPSMVESDAFELGTDLALSEGAVVLRTEVFELIQYAPQTDEVHEVPLLIVPPVINKFYIADLAPGRSMIEYWVQQGHQVFAISWRNPDARHREWDLDTYGQAVLDALAATRRVTGAPRSHVLSMCSGGMLATMTLSHLAGTQADDLVASLGLTVAVLDNRRAGVAMAFADEEVARAAVSRSQAKGFLDGRSLAELFAWLRANDLIWSYWVNNYLQGRKPAPFDVLFWNADTTRMAAGLHRDFVELAIGNALVEPGQATMLGTPVDLAKVTTDAYVVAGMTDHISPWQAAYRTTQMLGSETRFVLSTSGHVACMVNPPGNPKASFHAAEGTPPDPEEWLETATTEQGSWWPDYSRWLAERGGGLRPAPTEPGGGGLRPLEAAPGTYVRDA